MLSNANDGTNRIVLNIKVNTSSNPILVIGGTSVAITNSDFEYEIPTSKLTAGGTLSFNVKDDNHTGHTFTISIPKNIIGNWLLKQTSNFVYVLSVISESGAESGVYFTEDPTSGQVIIANGTSGGIKTSGYTIASSVPSDAKFTDTVYSHPTTSGNKHIPSGGSSGQILRWSADGTAAWGADNNTTYGVATTSANGLMSSVMVTKLNGIAAGANAYTLPTAAPGTKGGVQLVHGSSSVSVKANSYADKEITFSSAFSNTPGVMICRYATGTVSTGVASSCNRQIVAHSASKTGFKVRAYNNTSSAWTSQFRYLAIYRG